MPNSCNATTSGVTPKRGLGATAVRKTPDTYRNTIAARFAIHPIDKKDFHRPLHKAVDLDDVFCYEAQRTVQNDWTISYQGCRYQILRANNPLPKPKERILVRIHLDGRVQLLHRQKSLAFCHVECGQARPEDAPQPDVVRPAIKTGKKKPPPPKKKWRPNCDRLAAKPGY